MKRQELIDVLEKVGPGLASKEMIEQSTSFVFKEGRVITYNDEISVSHPLDIGIEGAVEAESLYKLLKKMRNKSIEFERKGNEIRILGKRSKIGLYVKEIKLPIEEIRPEGKWKKLPDSFCDSIRFCLFSCLRGTTLPTLNCVHVCSDGRVESSDKIRITRFTGEKIPTKSFLIPLKNATELIKYDIKKVIDAKGWIHFKTDAGTIFSCRIYREDYPDVEKHLQVEGHEFTWKSNVASILEKAAVFSKRDHFLDESVTVLVEDGKMIIRGEGESGWYEEQISTKLKDNISFKINPSFLVEIIGKTKKCIAGEKTLRFEGDGWEHVVCLMKG